ncbi:hypothetical protein CC80DRAFT_497368 [Byssothecium circinans]|uniref:Uncharacterized protein n=1 Tax=Byssothecium circinans TaxID=147558 RepID=A0A6A5TAJ7_9PLEO|nr:hypothetical protein CC80DRAFT_497368 [Byssothecium circinans]
MASTVIAAAAAATAATSANRRVVPLDTIAISPPNRGSRHSTAAGHLDESPPETSTPTTPSTPPSDPSASRWTRFWTHKREIAWYLHFCYQEQFANNPYRLSPSVYFALYALLLWFVVSNMALGVWKTVRLWREFERKEAYPQYYFHELRDRVDWTRDFSDRLLAARQLYSTGMNPVMMQLVLFLFPALLAAW